MSTTKIKHLALSAVISYQPVFRPACGSKRKGLAYADSKQEVTCPKCAEHIWLVGSFYQKPIKLKLAKYENFIGQVITTTVDVYTAMVANKNPVAYLKTALNNKVPLQNHYGILPKWSEVVVNAQGNTITISGRLVSVEADC